MTLSENAWSSSQNSEVVSQLTITVPIPRKIKRLRIVADNIDGGKMGSVDWDRNAIEAAPAAPTREPQLTSHRPDYVPRAK